MKSIAIIAGEASGDLYGSHLIRALKEVAGPVSITGMGGKAMGAAGADLIIDCDKISVMGITEVFSQGLAIWHARSRLKKFLSEQRPDLLILIDFPGFNLHMAKIAASLNIKVLYYISPKLWAWRPKRVKKIKARVDHMAIILPFEKEFYRHYDVPVTFVGHPLIDAMVSHATKPRPFPSNGEILTIGIWPGSRKHEVAGLLPMMMQAGEILRQRFKDIRFLISCAPSIEPASIQDIVSKHPLLNTQIVSDPAAVLFPKCHFAIVASGTVTLEAAIYCTPMVITYSVSWLSYWLGKALIRVDHVGLVNLIAEKRISPELIQHHATPQAVAQAAYDILSTPETYRHHCQELQIVKQRLGEPGASHRVARLACALIEGSTP